MRSWLRGRTAILILAVIVGTSGLGPESAPATPAPSIPVAAQVDLLSILTAPGPGRARPAPAQAPAVVAEAALAAAPVTLREGCAISGDVVAAADRLMKDRYKLGPRPTVKLPHDPTWRENPFHDSNWLFNYHSLRFVLKLEAAWAKTGKQAYLTRALFLLKDWLDDNPRAHPRSSAAWERHATAWRAMVYACTADLVSMRPWLQRALVLHGQVLADDRFYVHHGNHALNQAIGLLEVGCFLHRAGWLDLAADRINRLVVESVDAQGVTNEQAVGYQLYNYARYRVAALRLKACGRVALGAVLADRPHAHVPRLGDATRPGLRADRRYRRDARPADRRDARRVRRDRRAVRAAPDRHVQDIPGRLRVRTLGLGRRPAVRRRDRLLGPLRPGSPLPRSCRRQLADGLRQRLAADRGDRQVQLQLEPDAPLLRRAIRAERGDRPRLSLPSRRIDAAPLPDRDRPGVRSVAERDRQPGSPRHPDDRLLALGRLSRRRRPAPLRFGADVHPAVAPGIGLAPDPDRADDPDPQRGRRRGHPPAPRSSGDLDRERGAVTDPGLAHDPLQQADPGAGDPRPADGSVGPLPHADRARAGCVGGRPGRLGPQLRSMGTGSSSRSAVTPSG